MGRRIGLYFSWSRPLETAARLEVLEHRFPALFELRRAAWPHFEEMRARDQGIAGFLDNVVLSGFERCRAVMKEAAGPDTILVERTDRDGGMHLLDDELLAQLDTLIVLGLDNAPTGQRPLQAEIDAIRRFLARSETCVVVSPHHAIGVSDDPERPGPGDRARLAAEHAHHGDALVTGQQQLGDFARALLAAIELPVESRFGLKPALTSDGAPEPLERTGDDDRGLLEGVSTFNAHVHLPHLDVPAQLGAEVRVLARQRISPVAPAHPFTNAGNTHFNALVWAPPARDRRGDVLVTDATLWSSHFGGVASLERLWQNIATM